jgi:hypothetical protein
LRDWKTVLPKKESGRERDQGKEDAKGFHNRID